MSIYDVIVVGLGISGLRVAQQLEAYGLDWVGLEGQSRLGGRTESITLANGRFAFEAGGEFLKPGHALVRSVLEELGLEAIPLEHHGAQVYVDRGTRQREDQKFDATPELRREYLSISEQLDVLAACFGEDIRVEGASLQGTDSLSVEKWLAQSSLHPIVSRRVGRDLTFGMAGAAEIVSFEAALAYRRSAALGLHHGYGDARIVGGGSAIVQALEAQVPKARLHVNETVKRIDWDGHVATVATSSGTWQARRICLAVSPALSSRISLGWHTTPGFETLTSRWVQSYGLKSALFYSTPWWRERGLSGFAEGDRAASYVMDTSPPDGSYGVLTLLANENDKGLLCSAQLSTGKLRELLERDVEAYLGEPTEHSLAFAYRAWREFSSLAAGCGSPLPPGTLSSIRHAWGRPEGPLVWAGTESARAGWGSIEGALNSANEAVNRLIHGSGDTA